jgi:hypothetical protein
MHAGTTLLQYQQYKADRTRYIFVHVVNPTRVLGEVFATVDINGHAITALKDGIQMAYVPPKTSNWALVYIDVTTPSGVFSNVDSVSISCTPYVFEK